MLLKALPIGRAFVVPHAERSIVAGSDNTPDKFAAKYHIMSRIKNLLLRYCDWLQIPEEDKSPYGYTYAMRFQLSKVDGL